MEEDIMAASSDLVTVLRGWGQLKANDSGWATFDGRYASYPRFKREWMAYRETYHSMVNDDLAAKTLREKCVKGDALRMVSHLDDLREIWDTLDTCFERPEKYMEEALQPIVEFRKYKAADSSAVREFYSVLRVAIKGARSIGRQSLLINDQTVPQIMGKMPYADWKEWATKRPEWMREDMGLTFEKFVERKWKDALNVAAAEPQPWGSEREKAVTAKAATEKAPQGHKGTNKMTGIVNVVNQQPPHRALSPTWEASNWTWRKCRAQAQIGCDGNHVVLQCARLRKLGLSERRWVLERSGLCMYCLKHAAELECYSQEGLSKPRCQQPECGGEHSTGAHTLLGEVDASVNLVTGEDCDSEEDEEWWVNTVRVEGEGEDPAELESSESGEHRGEADRYCISACKRKGDSGLEGELEYCTSVTRLSLQIQTSAKRTEGGPWDPESPAQRRMRRKSSTSSACLKASPSGAGREGKKPRPGSGLR
jgi:hypothetical protein